MTNLGDKRFSLKRVKRLLKACSSNLVLPLTTIVLPPAPAVLVAPTKNSFLSDSSFFSIKKGQLCRVPTRDSTTK